MTDSPFDDILTTDRQHQDDSFGIDDTPAVNVNGHGNINSSSSSSKEESKELKSEEVSALSLWEEKRSIFLKERQQKADESKRELIAKAKEDLDKYYSTRGEKIQTVKAQNRNDEKAYMSDLASLMKSGAVWEKVTKFTNLTAKNNEKRPVDRMRKLLIQLKNEKAQASAVANAEKKEI